MSNNIDKRLLVNISKSVGYCLIISSFCELLKKIVLGADYEWVDVTKRIMMTSLVLYAMFDLSTRDPLRSMTAGFDRITFAKYRQKLFNKKHTDKKQK